MADATKNYTQLIDDRRCVWGMGTSSPVHNAKRFFHKLTDHTVFAIYGFEDATPSLVAHNLSTSRVSDAAHGFCKGEKSSKLVCIRTVCGAMCSLDASFAASRDLWLH